VSYIFLFIYISYRKAQKAHIEFCLRLTFLKFISNVSRLALSRSACSRNIAAFLRTNVRVSYQSSLHSRSFFTRSAEAIGRIKIAFQRVVCCCVKEKYAFQIKKKKNKKFQERNLISYLFSRFNKRINFRFKNVVILKMTFRITIKSLESCLNCI